MKTARKLPSYELLHKWFRYDQETGLLFFKSREDRRVCWNSRFANKLVTNELTVDGYVRVGIRIDGKDRRFLAHRIAFKMMVGRDPLPGMVVDHRNTIKNDNRWENLREATEEQNSANKAARSKCNVKGVFAQAGKFYFQPSIPFETLEEAKAASESFYSNRWGEFARLSAANDNMQKREAA